jgi:aquaporin Z
MMRDRTAAALIAEAFGTFLFFFVGAGSVVLGDYLTANGGTGPGLIGVAFAHGLALAVVVSALGAVSGGHFNPAVTLGVWIMGRVTTGRAALYMLAQLLGGLAAGLALKVVFADSWQPSNIGTPALGAGITPVVGIGVEAVLTALLVLAVIGTAVDPRGPKIGGR